MYDIRSISDFQYDIFVVHVHTVRILSCILLNSPFSIVIQKHLFIREHFIELAKNNDKIHKTFLKLLEQNTPWIDVQNECQ